MTTPMTHSVQLTVAADAVMTQELTERYSPTLYDNIEPIDQPTQENELSIATMGDVLRLMKTHSPIDQKRIRLDLRGFEEQFPRLVVYLSPIFYRWTGDELVIIPPKGDFKYVLPSMGDLLRSLELRSKGIRIISCPTCARCRTNFPEMVRSIEEQLHSINKPLDVAVMGCEVNGPGEAKAADVGLAFGDQKGMLFRNGEKVRVVTIEEAADALLQEIEKINVD